MSKRSARCACSSIPGVGKACRGICAPEKYLAKTASEVLVELETATAETLRADAVPASGEANYLRFQLSPKSAIALAARVKRPGKEFIGDQLAETFLIEEHPGEASPYELSSYRRHGGSRRCIVHAAGCGGGRTMGRSGPGAQETSARHSITAISVTPVGDRSRQTPSSLQTAPGITPSSGRRRCFTFSHTY